jgi:hypothetical protein
MYGTENNWTSINLHARTNPKSDGFPSGSIRTFCLKGPEIGNLRHLNVNVNECLLIFFIKVSFFFFSFESLLVLVQIKNGF